MRMGRYAALAAAAGLGLGGCGSSANDEPATASSPTATTTPRPVSTSDPRTQEIREAANEYLAASARGDWTTVCATLARSERRYFDRRAGACEAAFRANAERVGRRELRRLRNARAGEIRINDDTAVIEVSELGWREVLMRLYATHEDGRWGIARSKKRRGS
jgi:hypothetical protein